jgi:hypothetical protein
MSVKLATTIGLWIESCHARHLQSHRRSAGLVGQPQWSDDRHFLEERLPLRGAGCGRTHAEHRAVGVADLPDANGYTRLETQANLTVATPFNVQIRKGGSSGTGADVVFEGAVYATDFNNPMSRNDAVKYSVTLVASAAPTTDVLA